MSISGAGCYVRAVPLRFVLLLADGPRELTFVDGAAQLLATSYRGALKRVNLRQVGEAELQVNVGESVYHDGEGEAPGRIRLRAGSMILLGPALGVVLSAAPLMATSKGSKGSKGSKWSKGLERLARACPEALLRVAALAEPELLGAALAATVHLTDAEVTQHAALFAALFEAGARANHATTRRAALAALRGDNIDAARMRGEIKTAAARQALVGATVMNALTQEDAQAAAKQREQADAAAAHAAATSPEHDGARAWPTVAWDVVAVAADRGQGWFRGESSLPAERVPRACADGSPMTHLCTLLVPREYRTRQPDLVALALFQGLKAGRGSRPRPVHPHEIRMEDHIGGDFAMVWLTADELARGPAGKGACCVELCARFKDPNVGKPTNGRGYKRPTPEQLVGRARVHFGGTTESHATKVQPRYLHVDQRDVGGNFAGDDAHLDLERMRIFWGED